MKKNSKQNVSILAIDPGLQGAFVWLDVESFSWEAMPIADDDRVNFHSAKALMERREVDHIYLERAVAFSMGTTSAFNYGRDFQSLILAIESQDTPYTLIEPAKWTKVMHQGIDKDLKPKAKSLVAVNRLYKKFLPLIPKGPKSGKLHEGVVDALLIAGFGMRHFTQSLEYEW